MTFERGSLSWAVGIGALGWAMGSADTVSATPLRVLGATDQSASVEDPRVTKKFTEAVRLYKQDKAEQALPVFRAVAEQSGSPNAHLYIGHCLVRLRKYVQAHQAFSITIKEIGKRNDDDYEATREAAQAQLSWLSARVAKLVISPTELPPKLVTKVDGKVVDPSDLGGELVLAPGAHRVEASADGVVPVLREVDVGSGESKTISLAFQKVERAKSTAGAPLAAPKPEGNDHRGAYRTLGFAAGGVGVVGLAVFTVAGLEAKSTHEELERDCPSGPCSNAGDPRIQRGRSQQTLANVGLATGVIGVAASGALLYFGFSGSTRSEASVALTPERATVTYRVRF